MAKALAFLNEITPVDDKIKVNTLYAFVPETGEDFTPFTSSGEFYFNGDTTQDDIDQMMVSGASKSFSDFKIDCKITSVIFQKNTTLN